MNEIHPARQIQRKKRIWKGVWYTLLTLFCFVLYSDPHLMLYGVRPNLLIPLFLCCAMFEGILPASVLGAVCGLLTDMVSPLPFATHGLLFFLAAFGVAVLMQALLRSVIVNALLLTCAVSTVLTTVEFFALYGAEANAVLFLRYFLPGILLTTAGAAVLFYPIRLIAKKLRFVL